MSEKKTILAIGAHMDDVWYGLGGLALTAVKRGHRVVFINTVGDYSNWPTTQGREAELKSRVRALAEQRGIEIRFLGYKYEHVPDDVECMTELAKHCDEVAPDFMFYQWHDDTNRDHWKTGVASVYGCGHAACFLARPANVPRQAYAYQLDFPQCRNFTPNVYFDVTEALPNALEVLAAIDRIYAEYYRRDLTRSKVKDLATGREFDLTVHGEQKFALAVMRGAECGARYAEAFYALTRRPAQQVLDI
ncbi:MAG: hypothetical protein FJ279_06755 [Planctomycetes bacterium]|nr:hypothetical protein [Planctomycetota bacterium]MBM4079242.1 hypothetical protein [Planctomycetota bacterium]MBM4084144.1 hypothetical protein [Planctomycetota bacterium]